jgi:hypothetical protein
VGPRTWSPSRLRRSASSSSEIRSRFRTETIHSLSLSAPPGAARTRIAASTARLHDDQKRSGSRIARRTALEDKRGRVALDAAVQGEGATDRTTDVFCILRVLGVYGPAHVSHRLGRRRRSGRLRSWALVLGETEQCVDGLCRCHRCRDIKTRHVGRFIRRRGFLPPSWLGSKQSIDIDIGPVERGQYIGLHTATESRTRQATRADCLRKSEKTGYSTGR